MIEVVIFCETCFRPFDVPKSGKRGRVRFVCDDCKKENKRLRDARHDAKRAVAAPSP